LLMDLSKALRVSAWPDEEAGMDLKQLEVHGLEMKQDQNAFWRVLICFVS
jgi:hypothetical protein